MVAPHRFCHVVYRTYRFEQMTDWYIRALEAHVQHQGKDIVFLTYDDEHHRVAIARLKGGEAEAKAREGGPRFVAHVAYAWKNLDELLDTYKRLKRQGILPVRPTRHGLTLSMYYADPDGNGLEFQIDLLNEKEASEYMLTDEFGNNPSGEHFDPDELVARYEAGEAVDDLIFRPQQPQRFGKLYRRGAPSPLAVA